MRQIEQETINTIRVLSAEAIEKANSGHPGLPMGAAPMAYELWAKQMNHNPSNPNWINRDRFVLSAGHGSMLLYSLLHLFGYGLEMDELKQFRQLDSLTPGHPEYGHTVGIETTTGPLGAGFATAVGMAMAEANLSANYNKDGLDLVDHTTFTLVGDGCLMEGITSEAASLAGTLKLGKLIALYDSNSISIEGSTDIAFTEDVSARFRAYGWQVIEVADGNDIEAIGQAIQEAKKESMKPSLLVVTTEIGYGCPAKQGSHEAHGAPLGKDNLIETKKNLGMPTDKDFYVSEAVYSHTQEILEAGQKKEAAWNDLYKKYQEKYPDLAKQFDQVMANDLDLSALDDEAFWSFEKTGATRAISGQVIQRLTKILPNLFGGAADLAPSTKTYMADLGDFSADDYSGMNLHFGVRELAMTAMGSGIALHGGFKSFVSTFFVFSDYMKPMIRLAALQNIPVTYVLTHDSMGVGEDGPTHQPVEQLASLRSIPGLVTFRPADPKEVAAGWYLAIQSQDTPTALVLTRQGVDMYEKSGKDALKGGYILDDSQKEVPDAILMASGSEVGLVMKASKRLKEAGHDVRVVSMPSFELFNQQSEAYKESVLPKAVRQRVAVEAASGFGWSQYVGLDGAMITQDTFGASGPGNAVFEKFGFTVDNVVETTKALLK